MKNRFYNGCMIFITAVMVLCFLLITVRLLAKEVLVDRLDIRNEFVSLIADYYWGDQVAAHPEENLSKGTSDHYLSLRNLFDEASLANDGFVNDSGEDLDNGATDPVSHEGPFYTVNSYAYRYTGMVNELESDINNYCDYHFVLRPYLTDMKLACYGAAGWNMAYARYNGDEFMLKNGVVCQAECSNKAEEIDTTLKEIADENGIQYLFVQYPYRVTADDPYVPYGAEAYYNENTDRRLQAMRDRGIDVMDLRTELYNAGWDSHEGFYLSDNHWKTDTAFEAAGLISEYLASNYDGFLCNEEMHSADEYNILTVDLYNPMLRENVNIYVPDFETSFRMIRINEDRDRDTEVSGEYYGTVYDPEKIEGKHFSNVLTAYSASNVGSAFTEIINDMDTPHYGTVIYVSNSFSWHVIPYLAMDCDRIYFVPHTKKEYVAVYAKAVHPDVIIEAMNK